MNVPPLHRFEEYGALSEAEREAVLALPRAPYSVAKGGVIAIEGEVPTGFFLLVSGWAASSTMLSSGKRQITKIHLPGDALGTPSMAMRRTTEGLFAITEVIVAKVAFADFGALFDTHPRISARFMLSIQQERIALMDRLAAIGQTSGEARVAAFLLGLRERLEPLGLVDNETFDVCLTQEQIGDVLGLSNVHVNRMLATLVQQDLLRRDGRRYRLLDVPSLVRLADRPVREPFPDQSWLPAAR